MVFLLHFAHKDIPFGPDVFLGLEGHGKDDDAVARNGIVQLAGVEADQAQAVAFLHLIEEACQDFQRIGAFLVDVVAGVSAHQSFQRGLHEEPSLGSCLACEGERCRGVAAAGTAHENLPLVLRVEVDEHVAGHKSGLHALGAGQTGFLVACEHTFQRSVLQVVAIKDGQFDGASNAVVGAQRGALGLQPFAVNLRLDGVVVEVEVHVNQFLTHHVHVALQDDGGLVLHALGGGLADDDVSRLVNHGFEAAALSELPEELNHFLLALRGAGNFIDACKLLEHACRLQFFFNHNFTLYLLNLCHLRTRFFFYLYLCRRFHTCKVTNKRAKHQIYLSFSEREYLLTKKQKNG